jgi:hypothetical protein
MAEILVHDFYARPDQYNQQLTATCRSGKLPCFEATESWTGEARIIQVKQ